MRFWVLHEGGVLGPYSPEQLRCVAGFGPETKIAEELPGGDRGSWQSARDHPFLRIPVNEGASAWWVCRDDQIIGPFDENGLRALPGFGPATLICPAGRSGLKDGDWVRAEACPELLQSVPLPGERGADMVVSDGKYARFFSEESSVSEKFSIMLRALQETSEAGLSRMETRIDVLFNAIWQMLAEKESAASGGGLSRELAAKSQQILQLRDQFSEMAGRFAALPGEVRRQVMSALSEARKDFQAPDSRQMAQLREQFLDLQGQFAALPGRIRSQVSEALAGKGGEASGATAVGFPQAAVQSIGQLQKKLGELEQQCADLPANIKLKVSDALAETKQDLVKGAARMEEGQARLASGLAAENHEIAQLRLQLGDLERQFSLLPGQIRLKVLEIVTDARLAFIEETLKSNEQVRKVGVEMREVVNFEKRLVEMERKIDELPARMAKLLDGAVELAARTTAQRTVQEALSELSPAAPPPAAPAPELTPPALTPPALLPAIAFPAEASAKPADAVAAPLPMGSALPAEAHEESRAPAGSTGPAALPASADAALARPARVLPSATEPASAPAVVAAPSAAAVAAEASQPAAPQEPPFAELEPFSFREESSKPAQAPQGSAPVQSGEPAAKIEAPKVSAGLFSDRPSGRGRALFGLLMVVMILAAALFWPRLRGRYESFKPSLAAPRLTPEPAPAAPTESEAALALVQARPVPESGSKLKLYLEQTLDSPETDASSRWSAQSSGAGVWRVEFRSDRIDPETGEALNYRFSADMASGSVKGDNIPAKSILREPW
ncbi:MAG TPA: hypothetical protein DEB40_04710 [Elusimicrobia bacterium]|nr:hypothetical protein [Elusimicrobiota bacterium]HBT61024.1 hypothetical protein [Elusimicrobiota bacterium]